MTYQDYAALEGDERYELLDGELIVVASPDENHQTVSLRLASRMLSFVDDSDLGRVFHAPCDVLFTDTEVVQPDVMFVSNDRYHIRTPANIQEARSGGGGAVALVGRAGTGAPSENCTHVTVSGSTGS